MLERLALVVLVGALHAGCSRPNTRTIAAAVVDPTSGTAYAFEVDDSPNHADATVVIVCNPALPSVCYRFQPQDGASAAEMPAIRRVLMWARDHDAAGP